MMCVLCGTRRARRACPGVQGDICAQCCGTEREVTIDCPLDCAYLREARVHEKLTPLGPEDLRHPEVEVTEQFLGAHKIQLMLLSNALFVSAVETPGAADSDIRQALDRLVRLRQSDDTNPPEGLAAGVCERFDANLTRLYQGLNEQGRARFWSDEIVLKVLVFLHRVAVGRDNGRRKGRAFFSSLDTNFSNTMGGQ